MTELVIGARRSGGKKTLRSGIIIAIILVLLGLAATFGFGRLVAYPAPKGAIPDEPLDVEDARDGARLRYGDSSLDYAGDLAVLRLRGDALDVGAARGRLLGEAVASGAAPLVPTLDEAVAADGPFTGMLHGPRTRWRYRKLDDRIPGHRLVELAGTRRGAAASAGRAPSYGDLVRIQASLDVGVPATATDPAFRWVGRGLSFAHALETDAEGDGEGESGEDESADSGGEDEGDATREDGGRPAERLLVGRNFSLPGAADGGSAAADHRTVAFVHREDAIAYASVEWPGWIGVVSGMNAEGIAIMVHPAQTADVEADRAGSPAPLIARDVLEQAKTLDEATGVLREAEPLGAASFLIADGGEKTWIVVERSPETIAVRQSPDDPAVTGLLEAAEFTEDPKNDRAARTWPEKKRALRAAELLGEGAFETPEDAAAVLRDRRGPGGARLPPGHRGALDDPSASHAAIFDATEMVLYVAEGPGASGEFKVFDLRQELLGKRARPHLPEAIEAKEKGDGREDRAVLAARASLRAARSARADGRRSEAWTLLMRALARVPDLPEALVLAGDYASERGDQNEAENLYRRYLEAGADAPRMREEIRARLDLR